MASYDSDSSGGDEGNYEATNILLGYASKEPTDDTVSQLGGHPTWLEPATSPSGALAKCKVCNDLMVLLLQLNGDMPDHFPGHERRLYLFNCKRRTCKRKEGSIRALRGVKHTRVEQSRFKTVKEKSSTATSPPSAHQGIGDSLFGTKSSSTSNKSPANPFSTSTAATTDSNPFSKPQDSFPPISSFAAKAPQRPVFTEDLPASFASKAKISTSSPSTSSAQISVAHEPWPALDAFPPAYPSYYLDADYETLDALPEPAIPTPTVDLDEGGSSAAGGGGGGKEDKDAFESTIDRTFQRFADRLAQNPLQVLRYEYRGTPLLYSKTDAVGTRLVPHHGNEGGKVTTTRAGGSGMPNCMNCGAERGFELQLTSQAIAELEVDEMSLEGMEWGTIIVGVCSRDCQASGVGVDEVGYVEEWVGVQWEEVAGKR
ncbi:MAG: hypothetical protein M1812_000225 [Candelaria pacifica]|nr:MAG: hypothetical protein M1812_000225 [Candelaria pacifica]